MKKYLITGLFVTGLLFLSINCEPSGRALSHDDAFLGEKPPTISAANLKATTIAATPNVALGHRNVLWCGTFQLAWNEACALIGGDLHFAPDSPLVADLNKKAFTTNDLDAASYVALAGFVKDGIHEKIHRALDQKFRGSAVPELIPEKTLWTRPQDIVAYAYLFKNLEFEVPFEHLPDLLNFRGQTAPTFGMGAFTNGHAQMASQVMILDYAGPEDFVIELKTKSAEERLILAKIQPKTTLDETIEVVESRSATAQPKAALPGDELAIPKFNFDLIRNYDELEGAALVTHNPNVAKDLLLKSAMQDIRFQMDEKGVRLKSEAHISIGCAARPEPTHSMIFDKPFLLLLKRSNAGHPYFAMWISNGELFASP